MSGLKPDNYNTEDVDLSGQNLPFRVALRGAAARFLPASLPALAYHSLTVPHARFCGGEERWPSP
jgi:hypothetical protein